MWRSTASLFLILMALGSQAQFDPVPKAIRLGTDLTNIGYSLFSKNWSQYEFNADVDVANFFIAADYGWLDRTWERTNYSYNTSGTYYRVGIDHNFFYKKKGLDVMFIGFRYGASSYSDKMTYDITDGYWGPVSTMDENSSLSARWYEVVLGLKVQIWKQLFMGMTGRLKLSPNVKGETELVSFEIPGYGRADRTSYWGFNYSVYWRIPFRKDKGPIPGEETTPF